LNALIENLTDCLLSSLDINEACDNFITKCFELVKCVPSKTITVRKNDKPWFTSELRTEIRKRDRLYKVARRTNSINDINKFKSQRNRVNSMKKYAKTSFYENVNGLIDICNMSDDGKSYWKIMLKLNNKTDNSVPIPALINSETGNIVFNNVD